MEITRSWFKLITVIYRRVEDKLQSHVTAVAPFHQETFNQTRVINLPNFNTLGSVNVTFVPL